MTVQSPTKGLARVARSLHWSFYKRLGRTKPFDLRFDTDQTIRVRPIDRFAKNLFLGGGSEPWLAGLLDAYLRPGMVYFDIGAHIGQFVLMAAKRTAPTGKVHCFEAAASTFGQLVTNIQLNHHTHVTANHRAVYHTSTTVELHICAPGKEAFNSLGKPLRPDDEISGTESVQTAVLDEYCAEQGITTIDLMKIDVEGAEVAALKGGRAVLSRDNAPPIAIEVNESTLQSLGESSQSLLSLLREYGYTMYRFDPATLELTHAPPEDHYPQTENLIACKDAAAFARRLAGN